MRRVSWAGAVIAGLAAGMVVLAGAITSPFLRITVIVIAAVLGTYVFVDTEGADALGRACMNGCVRGLTGFAGGLAGSRHAHLREAWAADLFGDPETGQLPSASRRLRLAAGFVAAALRCRLDDAAGLAWRPVDAVMSSWHGSNLAMLMPVTIAAGLVLTREGFYGLINDADNLGVIAAAPYAAIKGLRKYRQIDTPKRPEKTESASGSKR